MAQIRPTFGPWGEWAGPSEDFVTAPIKGAFQLLHEHQRVTNSVLQSTMYGLHQSTWANILDFILFYLMQNTLPAVILVTTPKGSPLRYLTIPYLVWAASRFIRPFAPAGCPTWCQTICVLVLVVIQSINFLFNSSLGSK
jgi:integral membrane sensor domain MASE1